MFLCKQLTPGKEREVSMVTINGKQEQAAGMTILAYLEQAGYTPERVVVEKNLEIVPRGSLDSTLLEEGDSVEILRFVGGG
jgi:thiamine biosynthesis protein ThiS